MVEISGQKSNTPVLIQQSAKEKNPEPKDLGLDTVAKNQISEEHGSELEKVHEAKIVKEAEVKILSIKEDSSNSIQEFFKNGPPWFQLFRSQLVNVLNAVGVALNLTSVVASNSNIMPKPVADYLDKGAEWYSRYVVSLGFGWNGIESLVGKRPIEALSRFLPTMGFMALPFYNFNLATGISSFMSYVFDKVVTRNGGEQPGIGSAMENTMGMINHTAGIFKDFFNPDSKESFVEKIGIAGLGIGTFGGLAFAAKERDSFAARLFGNLRNVGGLVADFELIFNKDKDEERALHKRTVGATCSTASILNIISRWVNPEVGRVLNHLSIAADDFGLTYWAQMSKKDNDRASGLKEKSAKAKLTELAKPIHKSEAPTVESFAQAA